MRLGIFWPVQQLTPYALGQLRKAPAPNRNRLAKAIELADTTQEQVAEAIGCKQAHISAICNGQFSRRGLPLETPRKLAALFGCEIEDIFPAPDSEAVAL